MRRILPHCLLIATALDFVGCVSHTRVAGGYVLVTPSLGLLSPDAHPGTSLHYGGRCVWPIVFTGCFWPEPAAKFYHDGVFVFVGPVLASDGYNEPLVYPQLYAVRGKGPPVIISQRIFDQPLTNGYEVERISLVPEGVRVRFEYSREGRSAYSTNDVSWADIATWVHEAEGSAPIRTTARGGYRVLPTTRPTYQEHGANGRQPVLSVRVGEPLAVPLVAHAWCWATQGSRTK